METAFGWLSEVFNAILSLVPRIVIIRATHGGVKWRRGKHIIAMPPGLHIYWPLMTEIEVMPTARQSKNIPIQHLTTKDGKKVAIGVVVVYRIKDVVQAFGGANWDVDTTVNDISQAAVVCQIAGRTHDELLTMIGAGILNGPLTEATRKELSKFGVSVLRCKLTDFAECRVLKIMLDTNETRREVEE